MAYLKKVKGPNIKDLFFNSWYLLHSENVNCYPAAYITAIAMSNRSHFGIPIRTSLKNSFRIAIKY